MFSDRSFHCGVGGGCGVRVGGGGGGVRARKRKQNRCYLKLMERGERYLPRSDIKRVKWIFIFLNFLSAQYFNLTLMLSRC